MNTFNKNGAALDNSGVFGFYYTKAQSKLVLIPVEWDATSSYGYGASLGPKAIYNASKYVELFDINLENFYESGISLSDEDKWIQRCNRVAHRMAKPIIKHGDSTDIERFQMLAKEVDAISKKINIYIYNKAKEILNQDKFVGLIGGDHSISLGNIQAYLEKFTTMGILQIDAHCDLRKAFQGFTYSHGSVMYNVLEETELKKLVQVGVRGFCEEEYDRINNSSRRIETFFDSDISENISKGETWDTICNRIVSTLPQQVYISFDIDGLTPSLCPNTGTPVPGGLTYQQTLILIKRVIESKRSIVGFDLVEVTPGRKNNWDATVGAHILYQLCGACCTSHA
ncbi:agmatinase family protein [Patescibacteria group bacterium]|nr:agmatinase family protein [Patescibacteria group bacterium]MBU1122959.1 agmatinase family protein [Patescibacteria group bacterium]